MDASRKKQYLEALGIPAWLAPEPPVITNVQAITSPVVESPHDTKQEAPLPSHNLNKADVSGMDWDALSSTVKGCRQCGLREGCTQTVFGVGARNAELLVVGEGPGADEDRAGEPFVGRAGKLLDSMLMAIGRGRAEANPKQNVYIANIVKCRPPNNRDPQPDESAACRPYLERQIELLKPRLILAVGRIAAQNLLMVDTPIGKLRGTVHHYGEHAIPVIVTYHPAYLLRSPREKARAWDDLKRARALLGGAS